MKPTIKKITSTKQLIKHPAVADVEIETADGETIIIVNLKAGYINTDEMAHSIAEEKSEMVKYFNQYVKPCSCKECTK